MKNCLFLHLPRTGGSSIWHSLVPLATARGIGICDIYHETNLAFGQPINASQIVVDTRSRIGEMPCMFHHHTYEPLLAAFTPDDVTCATVLRDPVDRFVSEVFHCQKFLKSSASDGAFVDYHTGLWGRRYVEALLSEQMTALELLDVAATVGFMRNYYTWFYSSFLDSCAAGSARGWKGDAALSRIRELAVEMQRTFQVIGRFEQISAAFAAIVRLFEIGDGSERLEHFLNRNSSRLTVTSAERRRFRRLFHLDYYLVEELDRLTLTRTPQAA